ncbi:potassium/proton antiporter [Desulforhopalus sp. IMCC35007]|uniref:potassium/proton antiporter n=1 Tax=Desulforhopalus sp. IMCC35007 TaxID=2569543 RepID=UPI0010AE6696|nr:potassium/proton antiporter [Desulforhopalus sp. IMCC35007]TKB09655.1 potassium/proton antiporter [Desulforhopalus sp. IMCC35007]
MSAIYIIGPTILIAVVLAAVWLDRWSVPVILIALGAGIFFGSDVLNVWHFDNIELTNQVANFALVLILFHGGFSTKQSDFKAVALPAGGMATWGVVLTAVASFSVLYILFGWQLEKAILLAAIISSTDAAAIFSILRRQPLPEKLSSTVEIESAANDPMAILLTMAVIETLTFGTSALPLTAVHFVWQFTAAPLLAWFLARGALWMFNRLSPQDRGHYYVLTLGIALLVYGLAQLIGSSGMLAVFIAGYVMGNRSFVHKQGVANFSAALSTVANIGMFVLLGLQVFPRQWGDIWFEGLLLFLVLTFVARPLAVLLGTVGMGLELKEKIFISWAGLRGAVPIVLATYPAAAGIVGGDEVFNLVFFAVLLSVAVQGSTLGILARWLKLTVPARPRPLFNLELVTMAASDLDMFVIDLPGPQGALGPTIAELHLPTGAVIALITRGKELVVPKGSTQLHGWDQVTVLAHAREEEAIRSALLQAFPSTLQAIINTASDKNMPTKTKAS